MEKSLENSFIVENLENDKIYFEKLIDGEITSSNSEQKIDDFLIEELCKNHFLSKKKTGRKVEITKNNKNSLIHTKNYRDNQLNSIKTSFHKFIISYLNYTVKKFLKNFRENFLFFDGRFQKDITRKTNSKLLDLKISEILLKVKNNRKNKNTNKNKEIYLLLKQNPLLDDIFSKTYSDFYILYTSSKESLNILNTNIENYEDLIKKKGKEIIPTLETFLYNFKLNPKYSNYHDKTNKSFYYKILFENDN